MRARRVLPGDDLVLAPRWSCSHVIAINAPRMAVWPWVVQLAQGQLGSDAVVTFMEEGHTLRLTGAADAAGTPSAWAFFLVDGPNGTTRLLARARTMVRRDALARLDIGTAGLLDPLGFVLASRMLRTIKGLAEWDWLPAAA